MDPTVYARMMRYTYAMETTLQLKSHAVFCRCESMAIYVAPPMKWQMRHSTPRDRILEIRLHDFKSWQVEIVASVA